MPHVIVWTVGMLGATVMAKAVARQWRRVNEDLDRLRSTPLNQAASASPVPTLRRDPHTGVYRP